MKKKNPWLTLNSKEGDQSMSFRILSFTKKYLEDAAKLFTRRYKQMRSKSAILPSQYEKQDLILPLLRNLVDNGSGAVAMRGPRLVGFLTGQVLPHFRGHRAVWSPEWANAAEVGNSKEIYQSMYKVLSSKWVADGCSNHLITLFTDDYDAIDAWFWESFAMVAVDALRDLSPIKKIESDIEMRKAEIQDLHLLSKFYEKLSQHLLAAPTFLKKDHEDEKEHYEKLLSDPLCPHWFAYLGKDPVAFMGLRSDNSSDCHIVRDEKTIRIAGAFTLKDERHQGVATNLLNHAIEWAISADYIRCAVDFEPENIVARRFWLRHFQPICYILIRHIDERITKCL